MSDINVLPLNDLKEHIESVDCECKPKVEVIGAELLIVHNAWDHREYYEEIEEMFDEAVA